MKTKYFALFITTSMLAVWMNLLCVEAVHAGQEKRLVRLMIRLLIRSVFHPSIWLIGLCITLFAGFLIAQKNR